MKVEFFFKKKNLEVVWIVEDKWNYGAEWNEFVFDEDEITCIMNSDINFEIELNL